MRYKLNVTVSNYCVIARASQVSTVGRYTRLQSFGEVHVAFSALSMDSCGRQTRSVVARLSTLELLLALAAAD